MTKILLISILAAIPTTMEIPVAKIADDARVVDRVAAASKRDLPRDLLRRITRGSDDPSSAQ